jgi:FkbM family methyltransferase
MTVGGGPLEAACYRAAVLGKRGRKALRTGLGSWENYLALVRALAILESPLPLIRDEVFARSLRRRDVGLRTPIGRIRAHLNDAVDLSTLFGVFCRVDYRTGSDLRVAVDVGANIGLASLYFLSRNRTAFVYSYEPVPRNVETLRLNTAPFAQRIDITQAAVATRSGIAEFRIEPTGKFGGLTARYDERIEVPCVAINDVLDRVLTAHGEIDCLKLDVEGMENELLRGIAPEFWPRIRAIYAENCDSSSFMPATFRRTRRYNVERLERAPF